MLGFVSTQIKIIGSLQHEAFPTPRLRTLPPLIVAAATPPTGITIVISALTALLIQLITAAVITSPTL